MERYELKEQMNLLKTAYRDRFRPTQEEFDLWFDRLGGLRLRYFQEAVKRYIDAKQFPPTVADLKTMYEAVKSDYDRLNRDIKQLYEGAAAFYPGGGSAESWTAFISYIRSFPEDQRMKQAGIFQRRCLKFVEKCEAERCEVPDFAEYIGGME